MRCIDEIVVASTAPGANGLIAYPYLNGSLQPHNELRNVARRLLRRGAGLDQGSTSSARSSRASPFMLRENMELIEQVNHLQVKEIRSLGGGSRKAPSGDRSRRTFQKSPHRRAGRAGVHLPRRRDSLAAVALGYYPERGRRRQRSGQPKSTDWRQPDATLAACCDSYVPTLLRSSTRV